MSFLWVLTFNNVVTVEKECRKVRNARTECYKSINNNDENSNIKLISILVFFRNYRNVFIRDFRKCVIRQAVLTFPVPLHWRFHLTTLSFHHLFLKQKVLYNRTVLSLNCCQLFGEKLLKMMKCARQYILMSSDQLQASGAAPSRCLWLVHGSLLMETLIKFILHYFESFHNKIFLHISYDIHY